VVSRTDYAILVVVRRILEKHSLTPLELNKKRLGVSALRPIPDDMAPLLREVDDRRLLFSKLPHCVSTDSFVGFLRNASQYQNDANMTITSVVYSMRCGFAMAVFLQPYGKQIQFEKGSSLFRFTVRIQHDLIYLFFIKYTQQNVYVHTRVYVVRTLIIYQFKVI